jgi:hypothetical protein
MSENENVIDLNDLVKAVEFTVFNEKYEIPPMNDAKMKKVTAMSKKVGVLSESEREKALTDEDEDQVLDLQNSILHETVMQNKDGQLKQVSKSKFADWPMKLKSKVIEMVYSQLGSGAPEGETEKN